MNRYVLDTDTLILLREGQLLVSERALAQTIGSVVTSVITVDEQIDGIKTMRRRLRIGSCRTSKRSSAMR